MTYTHPYDKKCRKTLGMSKNYTKNGKKGKKKQMRYFITMLVNIVKNWMTWLVFMYMKGLGSKSWVAEKWKLVSWKEFGMIAFEQSIWFIFP